MRPPRNHGPNIFSWSPSLKTFNAPRKGARLFWSLCFLFCSLLPTFLSSSAFPLCSCIPRPSILTYGFSYKDTMFSFSVILKFKVRLYTLVSMEPRKWATRAYTSYNPEVEIPHHGNIQIFKGCGSCYWPFPSPTNFKAPLTYMHTKYHFSL